MSQHKPHQDRSVRIIDLTDKPIGIAFDVENRTDASQISVGKFFAMGSGAMRAAYGREDLFAHIGYREKPARAAGVLEASALPGPEVFEHLSGKLELSPAA